MLHILILGTVLGLSAGFAPGPLLTLVIAETLRYDIRAGIKVAIAPIITDLPIILFTLLVVAQVRDSRLILAVISFCGAVFIARLGFENLKTRGVDVPAYSQKPQSFIKGIITNLFSPHPYLFWLTVGVPIMSKAMEEGVAQVILFLVSFYSLLVGCKIFLALLVAQSKAFLRGRVYVNTMRVLGVILCMLAAVLFYDGIRLLSGGTGGV